MITDIIIFFGVVFSIGLIICAYKIKQISKKRKPTNIDLSLGFALHQSKNWEFDKIASSYLLLGKRDLPDTESRVTEVYKKKSIFISYAKDDLIYKNEMLEFLRPIEKSGVKIWNSFPVDADSEWHKEIEQKVKESDVIIVFFSISLLKSAFATNSIFNYEINKDKLIIPIYSSEVPQSLIHSFPKLSLPINTPQNTLKTTKRSNRDRFWKHLYEILSLELSE